jgi:ribosomal protein S18 acetylase RimI-like enzyme
VSVVADESLYLRGAATLLASFAEYARGTGTASLQRLPGVAAAVFPEPPERGVYNNALLASGLGDAARAQALDAMEAAYARAGVDRYAAWARERDGAMRADLEARGYCVDTATRAMAMSLDDLTSPRPDLDLVELPWDEYLAVFDLPQGLLARAAHPDLHVVVAAAAGRPVATGMAYEHDGDCGIYNVATLPHARRRGLGTAVTAHLLHEARANGCRTASLQSTAMAERVYVEVGFRDLGRFVEYVPPSHRPGGRPASSSPSTRAVNHRAADSLSSQRPSSTPRAVPCEVRC